MEKEQHSAIQDHALLPSSLHNPSSIPSELSFGDLGEFQRDTQAGKLKEAKFFLRENDWPISHVIRKRLWIEICKIQAQDSFDADMYYWDTAKQIFDANLPIHLPAFIDPSHKKTYFLKPNGYHLVERVLCVLGYSFPAITFSPTMYCITSLLLHYMKEDECYNCLCALISWKQGKFIIQTKLMYEVSWRTLLQLAKKFTKASLGNITKLLKGSETVEQVFELWLWWIFECLPFAHLVRVMDCFLYEGSKVLYRTAMAIILLFQKHTGKTDSIWTKEALTNGVSVAIQKFCELIPVPPEKLLKVAFGIRALSQNEVNRIILRNEMFVKSQRMVNHSQHPLPRPSSSEGLPTSQSQANIQMASHTLTVREHHDPNRARSMGLYPFKNFSPNTINSSQLILLWSWLPARITMYQPELIYTTEEHGCSLMTFYAKVENYEPTVIIIKTTTNEIFGAYCSTKWAQRNIKDHSGQKYTYFGTGETFLFTIYPQSGKYLWVGLTHHDPTESSSSPHVLHHASQLFMAGDSRMITIGGGDGHAIYLDEDIRYGRTEKCRTFNNPPLCSSHDFECKVVEVLGFSQ